MTKIKIIHKIEECIGCGACAATSDNWELDDEGKAHPKKTELDDKGDNEEAAEVCPTECIKIKKVL